MKASKVTERTCLFCDSVVRPSGHYCNDRRELGIGRCTNCGLVQVMDFSHVSVDYYAADFYFPENVAPVYEREEQWNLRRIARLQRELPGAQARRILDFGCGIGGFLRRAQTSFCKVIGFDLSERLVREHRAAGMPCFNRLDDVPSDIDTIVLFHVLEHVVRPWQLLASLRERFRAVDRFVLETPNTDEALLSLFDNQPYRDNHYSADHVYYFTNGTLRAVAERAGLRVVLDSQLQRYTLANTFGWLVDGRGGGQNTWQWFNDPALHDRYEMALAEARAADSVFFICEPVL